MYDLTCNFHVCLGFFSKYVALFESLMRIFFIEYFQKGQWICTQSSKIQSENVNEHITKKLEVYSILLELLLLNHNMANTWKMDLDAHTCIGVTPL